MRFCPSEKELQRRFLDHTSLNYQLNNLYSGRIEVPLKATLTQIASSVVRQTSLRSSSINLSCYMSRNESRVNSFSLRTSVLGPRCIEKSRRCNEPIQMKQLTSPEPAGRQHAVARRSEITFPRRRTSQVKGNMRHRSLCQTYGFNGMVY